MVLPLTPAYRCGRGPVKKFRGGPMKHPPRLLALSFASLLLPLAPAFGQSKGADLSGVVRDSSGAVVSRAPVTVRHVATNHTRQAATDDRGRYTFLELEVGRHEVTVESAGFRPSRLLVDLSIG